MNMRKVNAVIGFGVLILLAFLGLLTLKNTSELKAAMQMHSNTAQEVENLKLLQLQLEISKETRKNRENEQEVKVRKLFEALANLENASKEVVEELEIEERYVWRKVEKELQAMSSALSVANRKAKPAIVEEYAEKIKKLCVDSGFKSSNISILYKKLERYIQYLFKTYKKYA